MNRTVLGGLLGLSITAAAEAQPPVAVTITVPAATETPIATDAVQATVAGATARVTRAERVQEWRLVIAVDAPLSTPEGLRAAASLLAERAEQLVALGEVEIQSVATSVTEILAPTRDAGSLRSALATLGTLPAAGEVLAGRRRLASDASELDRIAAARDELQVLRWQREALTDWLLLAEPAGPRALFVLQDGFDFEIERNYRLPPGTLTGSPSVALDDAALGPALAAADWVVFPLASRPPGPPSLDRSVVGAPLADATGGIAITSETEADRGLAMLSGANRVEILTPAMATGPRALEIRASGYDINPPQWIAGAHLPGRSDALARRFLKGGDEGDLDVSASLSWDGPDDESVLLEVRTDLGDRPPPTSDWLTMTLYLEAFDAPPQRVELSGAQRPLEGVDRWIMQAAIVLAADSGELVAIVTDASSGRWGATVVDEDMLALTRPGPGLLVEQIDLRPPKAPADRETSADTTIRLLSPSGDLRGRQRFQTLVTSPAVVSVRFFLDDELVHEDGEAPFAVRVDLGRNMARHTIRAEALDVLGDVIGSDSIRINEPARSFEVSITGLTADPQNGSLSVEAEVAHPTDVAVDRLEFYFNDARVAELREPPWRTSFRPGAPGTTDYIRVVAHLDDGRSLEDVRLMSSPGAGEVVEVNLVQLYVVATDRDGEPVTDLTEEDFDIRLQGETQRIERFAFADEVPLLLGLVVDTSPSMYALMPDTKKAAARFLTDIVTEQDKALVIDFDTRPRLAAELTGDITDLLISLGSMKAESMGTTALYDSVIFGALQLPAGQNRKALVLLTDGDDYKSRFGAPRAIQTAKQAGVPVYIVSLAGIHDPRRQFRRTELDALTGQTGGGSYYLGQMSELSDAYAQIARELRSQYLIAFPTSRQLTEDDLESLRVRVGRPGLELRTVVGGRSVN